MSVSSEQLRELGLAHHRGETVACPLCTAQLETKERRYMPRISVPVQFFCPRDGYLGEFDPPELRMPWSEQVIRQILDDHLRHKDARCPEDGAKLSVVYRASESGEYVHLTCPSCGRLREGTIESRRASL